MKRSDAIKSSHVSILYFAPYVPSFMCGTSIHAINVLDGLYRRLPINMEMTICMGEKAILYFELDKKYPKCKICTEYEIDTVYDIALVPSHLYYTGREFLPILDRVSLKWVMWPLDSIYLSYINEKDVMRERAYAKQCIDYLDGIIFFSRSAREDLINRFPECKEVEKTPSGIIPIVGNFKFEANKPYNMELPYEKFVLIIGNRLPHKRITETIEIVAKTDNNYIVIGTKNEGNIANNIYGYPSGKLSDIMMENLYAQCEMLVFPSVYEGFGLPVIEALSYGKNVIAYECDLNHELEGLRDEFVGHIYYFEEHEQIPQLIEDARDNTEILITNAYDRTWDDVADELIEFVCEVDARQIDLQKIENRHYIFELMDCEPIYRHKTLINIVSADYDKCNYKGVLDIYGFGINGKAFFRGIVRKARLGYIVDQYELDVNCGVPTVKIDDYEYHEDHLVVIVPEYEYGKIKKNFIKKDKRFANNLITVSEFIDKYIDSIFLE